MCRALVVSAVVIAAAAAVAAVVVVRNGDMPSEEAAPAAHSLEVARGEADYAYTAASVHELAQLGQAAVRAVAREAVPDPLDDPVDSASGDWEWPGTLQRFAVVERLWGEVPDEFAVHVTGGWVDAHGRQLRADGRAVRREDAAQLVEFPEEPQFTESEEYLLVLVARQNSPPDQYFTVGPAEGRYRIIDEVLHGVAVDRAAEELSRENAVSRQLVGQSYAEGRRLLLEARATID